MKQRKVERVVKPTKTWDGAGVAISRSIGMGSLSDVGGVFLLLDHFGSRNPDEFMAGFPWHPHTGMETVTYMMHGRVEHRDSAGHSGTIGTGDVQWMTSGKGVMHEEMPKFNPDDPEMAGFQLWVNLPNAHKHCAPRYQDVPAAKVPLVTLQSGVKVKVIAGSFEGVNGSITEVHADPTYFDVELPSGCSFSHSAPTGHVVVCYLYSGAASFGPSDSPQNVDCESLVIFDDSGSQEFSVRCAQGSAAPAKFLVLSGKKINEPVFRHGPFVASSHEEIAEILRSIDAGAFPPK